MTETATGLTLPTYEAIDSTATPAQKTALDASFARTPSMINFLADRFGPYPFDSVGGIFDQVPTLGYALEVQTKPAYAYLGRSDATMLHELAHQWFGDSVSPAQWSDIWFNEGWAEWSTWYWDYTANGATETPRRHLRQQLRRRQGVGLVDRAGDARRRSGQPVRRLPDLRTGADDARGPEADRRRRRVLRLRPRHRGHLRLRQHQHGRSSLPWRRPTAASPAPTSRSSTSTSSSGFTGPSSRRSCRRTFEPPVAVGRGSGGDCADARRRLRRKCARRGHRQRQREPGGARPGRSRARAEAAAPRRRPRPSDRRQPGDRGAANLRRPAPGRGTPRRCPRRRDDQPGRAGLDELRLAAGRAALRAIASRPQLDDADVVLVTVGGNDLQEAIGASDGVAAAGAGADSAGAALQRDRARAAATWAARSRQSGRRNPHVRIVYVAYPDYAGSRAWRAAAGSAGTAALSYGLDLQLSAAREAGPDLLVDMLAATKARGVDPLLGDDPEYLSPAGHRFYAERIAAALSSPPASG